MAKHHKGNADINNNSFSNDANTITMVIPISLLIISIVKIIIQTVIHSINSYSNISENEWNLVIINKK